MIIASLFLIKLIISHLITDFILQPKSWVDERTEKHFASPKLYLHGVITGITVLLLAGWQHWISAVVITISHILIDGWKSYQKGTIKFFLIDQAMHLLIIIACWYFSYVEWKDVLYTWHAFNNDQGLWQKMCAFVFVSFPAGILVGVLTAKWRKNLPDSDSLANAGKWIGIIERILVLIFVMYNEYSSIGLLLAAKGFLRFNEKERPEIKTEYLVIGTLISIGLALITGLLLKI